MTPAVFLFDGDSTIWLSGDVDLSNARTLAGVLAEFNGDELLIDCSALEFIDSTGLTAIAVAHERLRNAGGRLRLIEANNAVKRLALAIGYPEWLER
jgi:anti-anti-sigma factor